MMTKTIIAIQDLTFQYEGSDAPTLIHVNLSLKEGETVLLLGPSGCGKSTLLLCLNGIIPKRVAGQFRGRATVAGLDVAEHEVYEMAQRIGIVFQDPEAQFSTLYVEDEVAFGLENLRYPRDVMQSQVAWALQQVGLADKIGVRLDHLSGGEKQKVALASVLAMAPEIMVLDAPTANLDPASARDFWILLRHLKQELGKTVIIVEQQVDEFIDMVDRLVVMNEQGRIIGDGRPREVIEALGSEVLTRYGIWIPQIWELAGKARRQGISTAAYPLTIQEAYTSLVSLFDNHMPANGAIEGSSTLTFPEQPEVIQVNGLSHTYSSSLEGTVALRNVRLQIHAGDFCAIVGQNGAGKTTLAKYITKILEPPPGTLFLNGADAAELSLSDVTRHVGYVFQNPEHQFVEDTVYDELAYSLRVRGSDEETVRARVVEMLETFQLRSLAHLHPFALSQGEKRRLSVATMLIARPDVLILDEPTLGQDRATALALMEAMQDLNRQGKTIIFITHDMRLVSEYARRAIVMAQGAVIFQGTVFELFEHPDIMAAASLLPPPVVALTRQFHAANPAFPPVTSMREFRELLEEA
jgi:energy-coupling factor transporter ATP-binding protein EcfA2